MSTLKDRWTEVYRLLGLSQEFEEFHLRTPIIRPLDDASGLWLIPVIAVTMTNIFNAFTQKWVKVTDSIGLSRRQDLVVENSYLVYTDGGINLPIRMAGKPEHLVGMISAQEYFLLDLWCSIAHNYYLDSSSVTVCSGTRLDGWRIPEVFYSGSQKEIVITTSGGSMSERKQLRLIYGSL